MDEQERLHDKVTVLAFNFDANTKYYFQAINFKAKMLDFSINDSVSTHHN